MTICNKKHDLVLEGVKIGNKQKRGLSKSFFILRTSKRQWTSVSYRGILKRVQDIGGRHCTEVLSWLLSGLRTVIHEDHRPTVQTQFKV